MKTLSYSPSLQNSLYKINPQKTDQPLTSSNTPALKADTLSFTGPYQQPDPNNIENQPTRVVSPGVNYHQQYPQGYQEPVEYTQYQQPPAKSGPPKTLMYFIAAVMTLSGLAGGIGAHLAIQNKSTSNPSTPQEQVVTANPDLATPITTEPPVQNPHVQPETSIFNEPPPSINPQPSVPATPEPPPAITPNRPTTEINLAGFDYNAKTDLLVSIMRGEENAPNTFNTIGLERAQEIKTYLDQNTQMKQMIVEAANAENVKPELLAAIVYDLSAFNPNHQNTGDRAPLTFLTERTAEMINEKFFPNYQIDYTTQQGSLRLASAYLGKEIIPDYEGMPLETVLTVAQYLKGYEDVEEWLSEAPTKDRIADIIPQDERDVNRSVANVLAIMEGFKQLGNSL